jgi:hypothetical protein
MSTKNIVSVGNAASAASRNGMVLRNKRVVEVVDLYDDNEFSINSNNNENYAGVDVSCNSDIDSASYNSETDTPNHNFLQGSYCVNGVDDNSINLTELSNFDNKDSISSKFTVVRRLRFKFLSSLMSIHCSGSDLM